MQDTPVHIRINTRDWQKHTLLENMNFPCILCSITSKEQNRENRALDTSTGFSDILCGEVYGKTHSIKTHYKYDFILVLIKRLKY